MVATPIGNLEDISVRALRVLREVPLIAAEDTRRTAKLLSSHGIATPTVSFHSHNARSRVPELVRRLELGDDVALVSDAGTPGISDPGLELVEACLHRGIAVDPIPGPSAPLAAAVASGFPLDCLTIMGFCPSRGASRASFLRTLSALPGAATFFESPHRIRRTVEELGIFLGSRQICIARELTKVHQEFLRGPADAISASTIAERGEFTIVIGPKTDSAVRSEPLSDVDILLSFNRISKSLGASSRRQAVSSTAAELGLSQREVYAAIERAKNSGEQHNDDTHNEL